MFYAVFYTVNIYSNTIYIVTYATYNAVRFGAVSSQLEQLYWLLCVSAFYFFSSR